jgi:hypothetical protein
LLERVGKRDGKMSTADRIAPAGKCPVQVKGARLSETKMKADLASRFGVRSARAIHPRAVEELHRGHHLPPIKRLRSNN